MSFFEVEGLSTSASPTDSQLAYRVLSHKKALHSLWSLSRLRSKSVFSVDALLFFLLFFLSLSVDALLSSGATKPLRVQCDFFFLLL